MDHSLPPVVETLHLPAVSEPFFARSYGVTGEEAHGSSPSLPGHKLRQITDWMAERLAE